MTRARRSSWPYRFALPAALLVAGFVFAAGDLRHALYVYLASWLFVLGVVLGSMALLMIHALTGGEWGVRFGHALAAGVKLFPWAAVAVVPLLIGMRTLFPWLRMEVPLDDPYFGAQQWYLNAVGLIARTIVLMAIWAWFALGTARRLAQARAIGQGYAAAGLIALLLTATVGAVDWVMSLVPRWRSTDVGVLLFTSQLLIAWALAVLVQLASDSAAHMPARLLRDAGNLLFVMVLGWAYVSFIDYLTSWVADLPAETAWYAPRLLTGWWWLGVTVACLGLGIPFLMLLLGKAKQSRRVLCAVAVISLFAQWLNLIWLVLPSSAMRGVALAWTDPLISVGLLGLCAMRYRILLRERPEAVS